MPKTVTIEQLTRAGLDPSAAAAIVRRVNPLLASLSSAECWRRISQDVLSPDDPFALHWLLYETVFSDWAPAKGPPPAWIPSEERIEAANITWLMKTLRVDTYAELHTWSVKNREAFSRLMIERLGIQFIERFSDVADLADGVERPQWLVGAKLNIAESCFDASDNAPAIISQSEDGSISTMRYGALKALSNRVANALAAAGFSRGDAIAIDMPMNAESVAIYLGVIKAGGVVVSIADSFAPHEIQTRLRLANTKAVFTQDLIARGGKQLPLYEKVVAANAPRAVVLPANRRAVAVELREADLRWEQFLSDNDRFDAVVCDPHDHTNILFSSGTTGEPKAIPWTHTTPIKCAMDGHLHQDIQPGDVLAWPTNLGWMMGPWLIYASLINQATIALYDGAPTTRRFGEFVQDAGVTMLGVVPSLVSAWKNSGCMEGLNWRAIKAFSSTGECSNPQDMLYLMSRAEYRPVIEYCGGTEIGGGYITGTVIQPASPATFTTPALGLDLELYDENNQPTDNGEVFLIPPAIGLSTELLNRDHDEVYFAGGPAPSLRRHGDQIQRLGGGYYTIHGRVDDTMNLGGIKVSSAEIERVLNTVDGVRETAAIAVSKPSRLVIYVVLSPGTAITNSDLRDAMQAAIRQDLNPLFRIHDIVAVDALPRTASNKVMRRVLREMYK